MTGTTHLWPEERRLRDGRVVVSARIEYPGGQHDSLWFEIPEQHRDQLSDDADHFVVALALRMAKERRPVRVHGQVSRSLLKNLEEYLSAWSVWRPQRYEVVEIAADSERERDFPPGPDQAVCGFSGGVDSSFTALRHARRLTRFPEPLTAGVMVQGFDIPLSENGMYERAVAKAKRQLQSLDLELIPISTNFRALDVRWTESFGPAVAGSLMLFGRRFRRGLIAQGVPYAGYQVLVEGSNPLTDPFLSSAAFQTVPDGAAFSRADKIRVLSEWREALELLRVCHAGAEKDRNCCDCEKCIRNILTFRVLGLGLPACFEHDVDDRRLRSLRPISEIVMSVGYDTIIRTAEQRGLGKASWVKALRATLARNRWNLRKGRIPVVRYWRAAKGRLGAMVTAALRSGRDRSLTT